MEKLKKLRSVVIVLLGMVVSAGCVTEEIVKEKLSLCPEYFQQGIEDKIVLLPWYSGILVLTGAPVAWVNSHKVYQDLNKDPNKLRLYITPLMPPSLLYHEFFHLKEVEKYLNASEEWVAFQIDFCDRNYCSRKYLEEVGVVLCPDDLINFQVASSGVLESSKSYLGELGTTLCMAIPLLEYAPIIPGHVGFRGVTRGCEDTADCFMFLMQGKQRDDPKLMRKCYTVAKFAMGEYKPEN